MIQEDTYTFKEICKLADIPYSTGRFYRDRHTEFMYSVGSGRYRRYTYETIEVLRVISNAYKAGANATEVQERLIPIFPINSDEAIDVSQRSVTMPTDRENKEGNTVTALAFFDTLTKQQQNITEILQRIEDKEDRIKQLEDDNIKLKRRLNQIIKEVKKPWWKKIF